MKTIYFIEKKNKIQKLISLLFNWIYFSFISEKRISIEVIEKMLSWKNEIEITHDKQEPWFYLSNSIRQFYDWIDFSGKYVLKYRNKKQIEEMELSDERNWVTNKNKDFYVYYYWWILILRRRQNKRSIGGKLKIDLDDIIYIFFKKDKEKNIEKFIENKL